jgi:beta-glucosidase
MKYLPSFLLLLCLTTRPCTATVYVEELLGRMSLEEKTGQMTMLTLNTVSRGELPFNPVEPHELDPGKLREILVERHVGTLFNIGSHAFSPEHWRTIIGEMQRMARTETRLGIPLLYGIDALHGMHYAYGATVFPHQIGLAATWNPELVQRAAGITAAEARSVLIPWLFSPTAEPGRNPVHARFYESFGEDTHLSAALTAAMVAGYRGADGKDGPRVASTLKHFAGYSMPTSGRDRSSASLAEHTLREFYLPPFSAGIRAGAETVLLNLSDVNGVPVHGDRRLVQGLLKEEMGFRGVVVSDWNAVEYLHSHHHLAPSLREATAIAINAGIDLVMVPFDRNFPAELAELVREGRVPMARIDDAVRRVLQLKRDLGLFTDHGRLATPPPTPTMSRAIARQAAVESLVLLRNDNNVLPLSRNARVLVTGPTADSLAALHGGWSSTWQGTESGLGFRAEGMTILRALRAKLGAEQVIYAPTLTGSAKEIDETLRQAADADAVVLCLGEEPYAEIFGNINDLHLPQPQTELARRIAATGKPVVLVLVEGRPRIVTEIEKGMRAMLLALLPGGEGGPAIADVLTGEAEPGGRLPFTYPIGPNALMTYDHRHSEDYAFERLYPFGWGLSYTNFSTGEMELRPARLRCDDTLEVAVTVRNTGRRPGQEVVQLYVSDHYAAIAPPVKRLRRFEKVNLQPGESRRLYFSLSPRELAYVDPDNRWLSERGEFSALVGNQRIAFELIEDCRY